jgi:peroxin-16
MLVFYCIVTASRVVKPTLSTILSKKGLRGALFLIGEVLFITRPLIYVLFIRKYGIRSWTPWFLSLAMDNISNSIFSLVRTTVAGENQKMIHISAPEKDEVCVSLDLEPYYRSTDGVRTGVVK